MPNLKGSVTIVQSCIKSVSLEITSYSLVRQSVLYFSSIGTPLLSADYFTFCACISVYSLLQTVNSTERSKWGVLFNLKSLSRREGRDSFHSFHTWDVNLKSSEIASDSETITMLTTHKKWPPRWDWLHAISDSFHVKCKYKSLTHTTWKSIKISFRTVMFETLSARKINELEKYVSDTIYSV